MNRLIVLSIFWRYNLYTAENYRDRGAKFLRAPSGTRSSAIVLPEADCIVVLRDEQGNVAAGDVVEVSMFEGLV